MGRTRRQRKRKLPTQLNNNFEPVYNLLKWLHTLNLRDLEMKVVDIPNSGRGVKSKINIQPGDDILSLPLAAMITMDVVRQSQISNIFNSTFVPSVAIPLWLIYEDHLSETSKYAAYLKILPRDFDCLFLCCQREIEALPAWIKKPINSKLKEIEDGFKNINLSKITTYCDHCHLSFDDIFSYDKFVWAWTCVNTRCVYYEDESISEDGSKVMSGSIALAPFLDFFNHSNRANVEAKLNCQRGVYILKTKDKYKKNDEIFIKYGAYSNLKLLVEYGFIENDEEQDLVELTFDEVIKAATAFDSYYGDVSKMKYKFITYNNLHVNLSKSKEEFSWNCRGLLYILVTRDDNIAELLSKTYSSTFSEKENRLIEGIQRKIVEMKQSQLRAELDKMEKIQACSRAFTLAKELVKMYIKILNA